MTGPILVSITSASSAFVRGYGSRDLLVDLTGRAPVWVSTLRAWSCQTTTANDLVAACEARSIPVEVVGVDRIYTLAGADRRADEAAGAEARGELW